MKPYFGPTGQFPRGKVDSTDQGEIQIGIAADHKAGIVRIDFGTPTTWLGMPPAEARALAQILIARAEEVEKVKTSN